MATSREFIDSGRAKVTVSQLVVERWQLSQLPVTLVCVGVLALPTALR